MIKQATRRRRPPERQREKQADAKGREGQAAAAGRVVVSGESTGDAVNCVR
jgi:hypothetical protein